MRPVKHTRLLLGLMLCSVLASGCWDRKDPENVVWVSAIGVDKGPRTDYLFTFQMVVPRSVTTQQGGGGAGGGGGPGQTFVVHTVEAPDVISALNLTDAFVARDVSIQHAKAIVFGEEVARDGMAPVLGAATRYVNFRRSMYIMVARGSARSFLRLVKPELEANPAFWFELLVSWGEEANLIPDSRIHSFLIDMETRALGARAMAVAARPDIEEGGGEENFGGGDGGEQLAPTKTKAGETRRTGAMPVDVIGSAVFHRDHLIGFLTGNESRLTAVLRGTVKSPHWAFSDPADPSSKALILLRQQESPHLRVQTRNGRVYLRWEVALEGDLASIQTMVDYTDPKEMRKLELAIARQMEEEIIHLLDKTLHEWHVDLFKVGNKLRTRFATLDQWERFDWASRISSATAEVHVSFRLRRHGLQTSPAVPAQE